LEAKSAALYFDQKEPPMYFIFATIAPKNSVFWTFFYMLVDFRPGNLRQGRTGMRADRKKLTPVDAVGWEKAQKRHTHTHTRRFT
jgi:hypothetical protein